MLFKYINLRKALRKYFQLYLLKIHSGIIN
jgi:hypothetical protein